MRRRSNQRRKRSLHQITAFYGADSHKRVRHRRSPRVKPVRRIRHRIITTIVVTVLMHIAPK
ncbi:hypothetical protein Hanom_Chr03g00187591 [Helianthus anomalus]